MDLTRFNELLGISLVSVFNNAKLHIYKGTMPTDIEAFDEANHSTDLLYAEEPSTLDFVSANNGGIIHYKKYNFTPTASGESSWFLLESPTQARIISGIHGSSTAPMQLTTQTCNAGVENTIESMFIVTTLVEQ